MNSAEKRLSRGDCMLIAMGVFLIAAIIYIAMTSGGSPRAVNNAREKMWEYIDKNYPEVNVKNYGEKPQHIGANSYSLLVSDADISDICFYVSYTNGNISDDYYYNVGRMNNTLLRLEHSMGEYFGEIMAASGTDILRAEVTFPPRVRNDIPDSIYPDVPFDPAHPIYRGSTLTLICEATRDMTAAARLIEKAHTVAVENNILFSKYEIYGTESESAFCLEIGGVDTALAENGRLADTLESVLTGVVTVSQSDMDGVYVRVYREELA